jgi:hypothetical protein
VQGYGAWGGSSSGHHLHVPPQPGLPVTGTATHLTSVWTLMCPTLFCPQGMYAYTHVCVHMCECVHTCAYVCI